MPHTENRDWEVEFDEKFPTWPNLDGFRSCYLDGVHCSTSAYKIRDFIRKVEKDTYLKAAEAVRCVCVRCDECSGKLDIELETISKHILSLSEGNKNK